MNKEIKYLGYTANPSDYESTDGELAYSLNLENSSGSMQPALLPLRLFKLANNERLLFIHRVAGRNIYIFARQRSGGSGYLLSWAYESSVGAKNEISLSLSGIRDVDAIGNVLILSTDTGLQYLYRDQQHELYRILGSSLPDIRLSFALDSELIHDEHRNELKNVELKKASDLGLTDLEDSWETIFTYSTNVSIPKGDDIAYIDLEDLTLEKDKTYKFTGKFNNYGADVNFRGTINLTQGDEHEKIATVNGKEIGVGEYDEYIFQTPSFDLKNLGISILLQGIDDYKSIDWKDEVEITISEFQGQFIDGDEHLPEYTQESYQAIAALFNKTINQQATLKNKFTYPFFVRYGIRLYDGTVASISEPILMIPNSECVPILTWHRMGKNNYFNVCTFISALMCRIDSAPKIKEWETIIDAIDIYVSPQIWTYAQGEEFDSAKLKFNYKAKDACNNYNIGILKEGTPGFANDNSVSQHYLSDYMLHMNEILTDKKYKTYSNYLTLANVEEEDVLKKLTDNSQFYKLASIKYDDIVESTDNSYKKLDIKEGVLNTIVTQPALEDLYIRNNGYISSDLHVYNSRLNLFGRDQQYYPCIPASLGECGSSSSAIADETRIRITLNTTNGIKYAYRKSTNTHLPYIPMWYAYPDSRATLFEMAFFKNGEYRYWKIPLKKSDMLTNYAYAISNSFNNADFKPQAVESFPFEIPNSSTYDTIPAPSSIYLSGINNPFVFPYSSMVSMPVLEVIAISSAAKALSQGQFGQFPLYAFTDQGIWAIEVGANGAYLARQPIARDVCLGRDMVTQIDSAVLFVSSRGVMLLSGSSVSPISDGINSESPFDITRLPAMNKLHSYIGHLQSDACMPIKPFHAFFSNCRIVYDYPHQRLIIFNPDKESVNYAYTYSLTTHTWSMIRVCLVEPIKSYPQALVLDCDGYVADFSADIYQTSAITGQSRTMPGLLVTRPLKLDIPDMLKTIDTIIQRGNFKRGNVQSVLYGSRNLQNWHLIWSSKDHYLRGMHGTPYKYFRIALICNLDENESISGTSIQFESRDINKLR